MTLRRQHLPLLVGAAIAFCAVLGAAVHVIAARANESALMDQAAAEAAFIADMVDAFDSDADLSAAVRKVSRRLNARATFLDAEGRILADSGLSPERIDAHREQGERPEILMARSLGNGSARRVSESNGIAYRYVAHRTDRRGPVGFVRLAVAESDLRRSRVAGLLPILPAMALACGVLVVLSWLLVRRLVGPVASVAAVAQRVVEGDLTVQATVAGSEDMQRLAASVNRMKSALVDRIERVGAEQEFLRSVIDGLDEGLMLVDQGHNVLLLNRSLRTLLRTGPDAEIRLVGEVVRHPAALEHIQACLEDGAEQRTTLKGFGGTLRSFELHVVAVPVPGRSVDRGALALFFDITRLEALERVRQQFIADVSHELRTPVTSIKGALETLAESLESLDPMKQRFLEMACRQADRMSELISDLTDLSRIETGSISLDRRLLPVHELVRTVIETVKSRRKNAATEFRNRVPEDVEALADPRRLEQILLNLVDNGAKFSGPRGTVEIGAAVDAQVLRLVVEDDGPGIPEEYREAVFTRFFRVDKGRTREAGGTGLGLAIVKHLVKLHRGTVRVEERNGGGARFVIELPRI